MSKTKKVFIFILGFILPFIGAIISRFIKNEDFSLNLKRGSVISGLILFLIGCGISFYFVGRELGKA